MKYTDEELAKMIDHSLLHPTMTDAELENGCKLAAQYGAASVCIKPYAVKRAAELVANTGVKVGAVIGFPHGNSLTESKRYETQFKARDLGASRCGATATATMLDEYRHRETAEKAGQKTEARESRIGAGGY